MTETSPARRRWPRLFAGAKDEPRDRRASDAILLGAAFVGLALLAAVAQPQSGFERSVTAFTRSLPTALDGLWQVCIYLLTVTATGLAVATVVRRRTTVLRDIALAVAGSLAVATLIARVVAGEWVSLLASHTPPLPPLWPPTAELVVPATIVLTALPHLSKPVRRLGRWILALGAVGTVALGDAAPTAAIAGLLIAVMAAAAVHVMLGSCRGRPRLDDVTEALAHLGVDAISIGVADRQRSGLFVLDATDRSGQPVLVKVYGRDAHDTQIATTLWRSVWYREPGSPAAPGRLQQAEHEAFLTLLAERHGVLTDQVLIAGTTPSDDVLLVLRRTGQPLADDDPWTDSRADQLWDLVSRVHGSGMAHGQIDDQHLIERDGELGIIDFRGAGVAPTPDRLATDHAQALVTTAVQLGPDRAVEIASQQLGQDALAAALAFVQAPALTRRHRQLLRSSGIDLGALRDQAAAAASVEAPELQRLRRVTASGVVQVALLMVAFAALTRAMTGLDLAELMDQLGNATWWLAAAGFLLGQTPRFAQAVSALGASPMRMPLGPVYALQLATSYIGLAVPTSAARIAVNIRFFQRHGLASGAALAVGALDGAAGFVVQMLLLGSILLFTSASLDLDLSGATPEGLDRLVTVIVAVGVGTGVVLMLVGRWRTAIVGWVRRMASEALDAMRGLRSLRRLGLLFGGNLGSELLFASTLGLFVAAFGYSVGLTELVLINVSVALLAGLLPIPGGIGVSEGGLTFGLVHAGVPEETAFAAVLCYRLTTFYLPPIWGFFSLRWLERNQHL